MSATPFSSEDYELLAQTHPTDWVNPRPSGRYNLVVLGAGTAGLVCAAGAAGLGAKVALIEKHRLGGDCLNYGCVPSKALIRSARVAAEAREAAKYGVKIPGPVDVDFPAVVERMRRLRAALSHHDSAQRFRDLGVDVFLGEGRFSGKDTVSIDDQTLHFARAVIATGGRAADLAIPGLKETGFLTNETIFEIKELPRRLIVLGGGPIGCELGQVFRRFGSEVHLINRSSEVLNKEEPAAATVVRSQMVKDGIHFHMPAQALAVETDRGEKLFLFKEDGKTVRLAFDAMLVAAGRRAVVNNLGLEEAGVAFDEKGIKVNDFLQTTNSRIYSAGDVCSPYQFTHAADAMARIVVANALFLGRSRFSALTIPRCTYADPEIAVVGLTAQEAEKRGLATRSWQIPLTEVDRAVLDDQTEGFALVHTPKKGDKIIGATIVASHAGEMIGEVVFAMNRRLGLGTLSKVIHPYPTQAEVLRKLGDAYQRSRLTLRAAGLLKALLRWRRR
jgi:pyruvate/2-oxoglutarate dehydrogenase complex dihydrolipoamide dehydrogenase (E3) component